MKKGRKEGRDREVKIKEEFTIIWNFPNDQKNDCQISCHIS